METEPVRLGLMCPGTWGKSILEAARGSQKVRITVCASRTSLTAEKAAQEYGIRAAGGFEELLREEIDGVVIACPHHLHHEQTIAAARAGKHVLIEKPIANTVREAREMAGACRQAGVVLSVGHSQRRLAGVRTAKRMIASGAHGQPMNATAYAGLRGVDMYGLGHWLLDGDKNPGGSLYMMGVHFTETLQYIIGPIRRVSGFAVRDFAGTTIPEVAVGIFEFRKKCLGYLGSHYVAPYNSFITIYCEKGTFYLEKFGRELYFQDSPFPKIERRPVTLDPVPFDSPLREELEELADCIRLGKKPETGADEAIAALAAIRGIMVSAAEGRPVTLEEIIERD